MRKFGPKIPGHPSIGAKCPACGKPFKAGDYTTLVVLGPGNNRENRRRAREGRVYNIVSVEVHWDCLAEKYQRDDDSDPRLSKTALKR